MTGPDWFVLIAALVVFLVAAPYWFGVLLGVCLVIVIPVIVIYATLSLYAYSPEFAIALSAVLMCWLIVRSLLNVYRRSKTRSRWRR